MIQFLPFGADVGAALPQSYSVVLVVLSYLIAVLASYAGLLMSVCIANSESAWGQRVWLAGGSVAMGIGIWAMHFTGMLALTLPVPVTYNLPITLLSVIPAILASALALSIMSGGDKRHHHYLLGGTLVGVGIGAMHYVGMAAMHAELCVHPYDPVLFALSIVVAVALGIAAFYIHDLRYRQQYFAIERIHILLSAGLMGLAIAGMHYTAMAAVSFIPGPAAGSFGGAVGAFWLSVGVTSVAVTIAALAIAATIVGRAFQATTHRARVDHESMMDAIESISDGFTLFDDKGSLTMCNDVLHKIYPELAKLLKPGTQYKDLLIAWAKERKEFPGGLSAEEYIAESLRNFTEGGHVGQPREEQLSDGRWIYSRENSIKHGGLVSVLTDITLIKELQAVYEKLAAQDTLTGLVSRRLFEDRLDHAIALGKRVGKSLALLFIDLDRFKLINDTLGHDAGDAALREIALRLRNAARDSDTVARLGGDEFAVLIESGSDPEGVGTLAARIIDALTQPIILGADECRVGASVGAAILSPQGIDREALIKAADDAMYEAKRAGGNQYRIYDRVLEERT
ncbi:MAG TPA: diguanylate cyclase [Stellaceae bacterium]|nr:diguanylate cyclase [Stellaceae bacterium]